MTIFRPISRALTRLDRSLGSDEGTTEGSPDGFSPGLRHIEAAEHQEFPPEESAADEREQSE